MSTTSHSAEHPIRAARRAREWSQQELGSRLEPPVSKGTVSQWEADATLPTPALAVQLVDLFEGQVSLDDLYRRTARAA